MLPHRVLLAPRLLCQDPYCKLKGGLLPLDGFPSALECHACSRRLQLEGTTANQMFPQMQDVLWKVYIVDLASWWESEMQFIHVHPTVYLTRLCLFFQWMRDGHNSIQKSSGLLKECEQRDAHSESRRALPNPSKLSGLSLLVAPGFTQRSPLMLDRSIDAKIMVITETFWLNTNWCLDASPSVWFCGLTNITFVSQRNLFQYLCFLSN